jgi:succinate-semialdehyde dehydrogenase/glutarate-semialdehyde dehydrogenase
VFTRDIGKAYRFVEELTAGQVVVNDNTCWWDVNMPFGGAGGAAPPSEPVLSCPSTT